MQPQSDDEVRPIILALQEIDRLLDIRWNDRAVMVKPGSYTVLGKFTPPEHAGRWEVIRHQTENFNPERGDFAVLAMLTPPQRINGILCLGGGTEYAPVGEWVVDLMRSADAANVERFSALRAKLWAMHEKAEDAESEIDEAEAREGLDRAHFHANYAGGVGNWHGRGADFAPESRIVTP